MAHVDLSSLNDNQRKIVTTLDSPVFVAAGAGSGKTFTLTRRIVWALTEESGPYLDSLDQVLVITFTNAAAQEIAARLRLALRQAGLFQAALDVDSAWISTIHGMCLRILKRHALDLGLDPAIRLAHENEAETIFVEALEGVVGKAVADAQEGSALKLAVDSLTLGSYELKNGVYGAVCALVEAARQTVDSFEGLELHGTNECLELYQAVYGTAFSLLDQLKAKSAKKPPQSIETLEVLCEALESIKEQAELPSTQAHPAEFAQRAAELFSHIPIPRSTTKELKPVLNELKMLYNHFRLECRLSAYETFTPTLIELAKQVEARRMELERSLAIIETDDVVSMALDAVKYNEVVAKDYAGRFKLAMVDEFQDTDAKQLELISILSGGPKGHLATVGDAQQAIYGFRGADVGVFTMRQHSVDPQNVIRLATNYRSHKDILALVDRICGGSAGVVDDFMHLDYHAGRNDDYLARELPRIQMVQFVSTHANRAATKAVNAAVIADKFFEYHNAGEPLSHMALLVGVTTNAAMYIDAIRARGMSCVLTGGSVFGKSDEVKTVLALLWTLSSPKDSEKGLFPLLASNMFDLDATDFALLCSQERDGSYIKKKLDLQVTPDSLPKGFTPSKRLCAALDILCDAQKHVGDTPIEKLLEEVIVRSGWLFRLEREGEAGIAKAGNILAAIRYVGDVRKNLGLGPARIAHEFDLWLHKAKLSPAQLSGDGMDAIQIMTVHASKGLEFPIVALTDCWTEKTKHKEVFRLRSPKNPNHSYVMLNALDSKDYKLLGESDSPKSLCEWQKYLRDADKQAETAEMTRLLYVGLTRAREALIVSAPLIVSREHCIPELALRAYSAFYNGDRSKGAESSRNDFPEVGIYDVDFGGELPACYELIECAGDGTYAAANSEHIAECIKSFVASEEDAQDDSQKVFDFYSYERDESKHSYDSWTYREGVYSYSSASAKLAEDFKRGHRDIVSQSQEREVSRPCVVSLEGEPFAATDDADKATNFGSAFHELAQVIVESGQKWPGQEKIEASKQVWKLSKKQSARLDKALELWFASKLRSEVLRYAHVRAEVPFFSSAESSFGSYVEGAIDLLAYNDFDEAFLVDYKTGDRGLSEQEIYKHHLMQANFYAWVLMKTGFKRVVCNFVTVELQDSVGDLFSVCYEFDDSNKPKIGELTL